MTISENHSFWVKWACALVHGRFNTRCPSLKNNPVSRTLDVECLHHFLVRYYSIISKFFFPAPSSQPDLREPDKYEVKSGKKSAFEFFIRSKKMFRCKERKQNFASMTVSSLKTCKTRLKQVLCPWIQMQQSSAVWKSIHLNFSCLEPFLLSIINPV